MNSEEQQKAIAIGESRLGRVFYHAARTAIRIILFRYFRLTDSGREHLETPGPLILASVHRSNLDAPLIAGLSSRKTVSLAKDSLFDSAASGWVMSALGGFPVNRSSADRDALRAAENLLDTGASMIVFPEGTRQSGKSVGKIFDGASFLAVKTGAKVVPIGIAGTEAALPSGARFPRMAKVGIVIGEPISPPTSDTGRVALSQRRAFSRDLKSRLQQVFNEAQNDTQQD